MLENNLTKQSLFQIFLANQFHGYGVFSTNKERYLGEWKDGKKNGLGTLLTIDGVYHEGLFENGKFVVNLCLKDFFKNCF